MYFIQVAIQRFVTVVWWLIFIRVMMSWFIKDPRNQFFILINNLTDPILKPFRPLSDMITKGRYPIDLSPIFAILALQIISGTIVPMIFRALGLV